MAPASLDDFPVKDYNAELFLAYLKIIQLLGDITERCLRKSLTQRRRTEFENGLFRWVKQLPEDLRLFTPNKSCRPYVAETYQLLVAYFAFLIVLYRSPSPLSPPSPASLVASSFIVGIFQEFLGRGEICHLGPAFAFYALCAGLSLVPAYRYPSLRNTAEYEVAVIKKSLQELSKQWASAVGSLRALNKVIGEVLRQPNLEGPVPTVSPEIAPFFEEFGPALCRQWSLVTLERNRGRRGDTTSVYQDSSPNYHGESVPILPDLRDMALTSSLPSIADAYPPLAGTSPDLNLFEGAWEGSGFDWSGSWLLTDWQNTL